MLWCRMAQWAYNVRWECRLTDVQCQLDYLLRELHKSAFDPALRPIEVLESCITVYNISPYPGILLPINRCVMFDADLT